MPQLNLYVPEKVANLLRERAKQQRLSLSHYLAKLVTNQTGDDWPPGYFNRVIGQWQGELKRPRQGKFESRETL